MKFSGHNLINRNTKESRRDLEWRFDSSKITEAIKWLHREWGLTVTLAYNGCSKNLPTAPWVVHLISDVGNVSGSGPSAWLALIWTWRAWVDQVSRSD